MSKLKRNKIFALLFVAIIAIAIPLVVSANNRVVLQASEITNDDFTAGGESVDIAGTVLGDAMVVANEIMVTGTVEGDLLAAGGTVEVTGVVADSARLAGGQLTLEGSVAGNVTAFGGTYSENAEAKIGGNTYVFGGTITLRGEHKKNIRAAGGRVILEGKVDGSVTITADDIQIRETARIAGDLTYNSPNKAQIEDGAVILGKINENLITKKSADFPLGGASWVFAIWMILSGLVFAYVFWRLFRLRSERLVADFDRDFWPKVGWGFIALIVIPIMAVLLMVTIIGIPLGFAQLALYMIALYLGWVVGSVMFGRWLLQLFRVQMPPTKFPWIAFLVGTIFVLLVSPIPVLGAILSTFVFLWGFGTLVRSFRV